MKSQLTRIKTRASSVSRRSLAIVLCFVMLLTALGAGTVLTAIAEELGVQPLAAAKDADVKDAADADDADTADDSADVQSQEDVDADTSGDYEFAYVDEDNSADAADTSDPADVADASNDTADDEDEDDVALTKKSDTDLAETGDANVYGIKGSWDGWTNVTYFSGTTGSATASVSLTAGTTYYFKIYSSYGDCYYGANKTYTASDSSYYFKTSEGNATLTATYTNTYTFTIKREDQGDCAVEIGVTFPTSGTSTSTPGLYIYGQINGSTNWTASTGGKALTYVSSSGNYYYYYYSLNASAAHYFRFTAGDGAAYNPQNNSGNVEVSTNSTSWNGTWRNGSDGSQNQAFYVPSATGKVTLWVKYYYVSSNSGSNSVSCWMSRAPYYLTGYVNGSDTDGSTYAFSGSGPTYTYTLSSSTATQYVTIKDANGNAFHPTTHGSGSGVKADPNGTDKSPKQDNKWLVSSAKDKSVTFTWNANTGALTWAIAGNNVTVYAKDGAAPINWDCTTSSSAQKEGPGATGFSGYYYSDYTHYLYNYAAIATTTMTNGDGTAISGITTSSCDINGSTSYTGISQFKTATLTAGTKVKITTTINTTVTAWRTRYYVKGWCVNGVTYKCGDNVKGVNTGTSDGSSGAYTMYYTIPSDADAGDKFEITPIYYFADDANCITFYLEGFDTNLQTTWGNTPYAFPFYGNVYGYQDSFGVYPGQPMVYANGKYSMEIPITSVGIYDNTADGTIIKGVTVSNGYADHVHRNLVYDWNTASSDINNDETHTQTYDFDDFYKIYNEKRDSSGNRPNAIILRIKRETTRYNRNIYGDAYNGINWGYSRNTPYTTLYGASGSTYTYSVNNIASSGNGWELLTDRYGRPVDLFGNVISTTYSASAEQAKPAIRVISTGYNETISGDYGTGWLIYTPSSSGTYTTAFTNADGTSAGYGGSNYTLQYSSSTRRATPPSIFLLNSSSSFNTTTYPNVTNRSFDGVTYSDSVTNYQTLYNTLNTSGDEGTNAVGRYVYITYESDQQRKGKTNSASDTAAYGAKRLDARWYYTYATDMVSANIKIQYLSGSTYVDESSYTTGYNSKTNQGSYTGCKAYFTNTDFDGEMESGDVLINSGDFTFTAKTATGWVFDSWQIEYDGGVYTELSDSATASTPMSATDTLVARFKPLTTGYLNLSHELDSSTTGSGTTQLNVQVFSDDGKTDMLYESGITTDDVTLDGTYITNSLPNAYIQVTLTTTPSGDDKLTRMSGPLSTFFGGSTYVTYNTNSQTSKTFGFKVSTLFSSNTQTTTALPYYSRIAIQNHYYKFTYTYPKRGSANSATDGSYTVQGTFTAKEYETYVSGDHVLSGAFVKAKAPFESNFNKNMTLSYSDSYTKASTYNTSTYYFTVTAAYSQTDALDAYAIFDLPYDYYTATGSASGVSYKKYTGKPNSSGKILETEDAATFEIDTTYNTYFTSTGTQTNVSKITDVSDVNHTGNDFVTAPEIIYDSTGTTKKYFSYWKVMTANKSQELLKVYFPDFHYRACGNYYVTPVYSTTATDFWTYKHNATEDNTSASILYLGSTRNQWNSSTSQTNNTSTSTAADLIYNDFLLSYTYKGTEIKNNSSVTDAGMIIELVPTTKGGSTYAQGDASSADTAVYKSMYDSTIPDNSTLNGIVNSGSSGTYIRVNSLRDLVDNKNRLEYYYSFYSQYGQNGYEFYKNSTTDNYVFRAYAYIKDSSGITYSTPTYFCMRYTANRKG